MNERRAKGLFWDRAWKLVEGCTKVSPGCDNCWSETETAMRMGHPNKKISERAQAVGSFFNGNVIMRHDNLDLPLRTKKPTVWAIWNDLWHEDVPNEFIDEVYEHIRMTPQHTFLILTKRADQMESYLEPNHNFDCPWGDNNNVWHGVTVENQQTADERIPHLLRVPGKRFLSIEPMLGLIDIKVDCVRCGHLSDAECPGSNSRCNLRPEIHQVLLGGESGKNARPMHPEWVREVRDQCAAAGVPFYFKQWGEWLPEGDHAEKFGPDFDGPVHYYAPPRRQYGSCEPNRAVYRVGKKKAGRLLDGVLHDELAWDK